MRHTATSILLILAATVLLAIPPAAQEVDWETRYDGPGGTSDIALAMDTDAAGGIYVAGYSYDATGNDNVRLVKFSASGALVWDRTYDGGYGWDDARDVAVQPDGTVTVAGFTTTASDRDILVIQYDPAGNRNWLATWDGKGRDDGKSLGIDAAGNVYVAGEADGPDLSDDFVTLKFDADGNLLWERWHAGAGGWNEMVAGIAVAPDGVATVTGSSRDTSFDLFTIQYGADGAERWSDSYDPLGYSYEAGIAIDLDGDGRAYVAGIELTAAGTNDIVVIRYEIDGSRGWLNVYDSNPGTYDNAMDIAVKNGIVAVAGSSEVDTNDPDVRVIAYGTDGGFLWDDRYSGPRIRGDDRGQAVAIADDESVAVAGSSLGLTGGIDFVALRYDAAGARMWEARYDGIGGGTDEATGVLFADDGGVIVSGPTQGSAGADFAVVKVVTEEPSPGCGVAGGTATPLAAALLVLLVLVWRRRAS